MLARTSKIIYSWNEMLDYSPVAYVANTAHAKQFYTEIYSKYV